MNYLFPLVLALSLSAPSHCASIEEKSESQSQSPSESQDLSQTQTQIQSTSQSQPQTPSRAANHSPHSDGIDPTTADEFPQSEVSRLTVTGLTKFAQGNFGGAASEFGKAITIVPQRGILYLQRGLARLEQRDFTGALDDFNKADQLDKANKVHILICRGRAYAGLKRLDDALAQLNKAVAADQKMPLAFITRADIYLSLGEDDKALADLERALKLDPEQAKAYLLRARYFKLKKNNRLALQDFNKAVTLDSNLIEIEAGPDSRTAKELRERAAKALKFGRKSEVAVEMIDRGMALERNGEYLAAIKEFSEAIDGTADSLEAYRWRASVYMHMSAFQNAINDLTKAMAISPQDASLYSLRGRAYLELGSADKSIDDYTKAISLSKSPEANLFEARGLVYSRGGSSTKAIADFSKAIEIDPAHSTAYADRGMENLVRARYTDALQDFSESIKRGHDLAIAYKFRAQCRYHLGDQKAAISDLEKAGQLYKENNDLFGSRQIEKTLATWKKEPAKSAKQ